jgi:arsenate reductase
VSGPSKKAQATKTRSGGPVRVYQYAACGTCKKALKWLGAHGVAYESVPIVESPPSLAELTELVKKSGLPARKWINTSGGSYRALVQSRGKEAVETLGERELLALLAADGKMIKRPVVIAGDHVLVGFVEEAYEARFSPEAGR